MVKSESGLDILTWMFCFESFALRPNTDLYLISSVLQPSVAQSYTCCVAPALYLARSDFAQPRSQLFQEIKTS